MAGDIDCVKQPGGFPLEIRDHRVGITFLLRPLRRHDRGSSLIDLLLELFWLNLAEPGPTGSKKRQQTDESNHSKSDLLAVIDEEALEIDILQFSSCFHDESFAVQLPSVLKPFSPQTGRTSL